MEKLFEEAKILIQNNCTFGDNFKLKFFIIIYYVAVWPTSPTFGFFEKKIKPSSKSFTEAIFFEILFLKFTKVFNAMNLKQCHSARLG